jgi:predicted enzyme related to lactoylglutathione lyase
LEFIDDPNGPDTPSAHHIHYFVPNQQAGLDGRTWYVKTFGATENARRNGAVPSALFTAPDKWISVDFTAAGGRGGAATAPPIPNKGTILDHFALEVKGLDAFVKKIQADGVKVSKPVSTNADGLKTAMVVDSLGNEIELVEGLAGK